MLNWKKRLAVVVAVLMVPGIAGLCNQLAIVIEGPVDLNVKEAYFFDSTYQATYSYDNGTGIFKTLRVESEVINSTHSKGRVLVDGVEQGTFLVDEQGRIYEGGVLTENYSVWFVFIPNPLLAITAFEGGDELTLVDPTGFFGPVNAQYLLKAEKKFVYWPYKHEQDALLGAQASIDTTIKTQIGNEIGRLIVDGTSGLPFEWHWVADGRMQSLVILDTSFPISRNRLNIMLFGWIAGISLLVATFLLTRRQWPEGSKLAVLSLDGAERTEILLLLGTGVAAMIMEIVDIWFYLPLGLTGNLLIHISFTVWALFVCIHQKYGTRWVILAFLEVAYVIAMQFVDVAYIPTLTANMGSTLCWLALVWASGVEKHVDSEESGVAKAIGLVI